MNNSKRF